MICADIVKYNLYGTGLFLIENNKPTFWRTIE